MAAPHKLDLAAAADAFEAARLQTRVTVADAYLVRLHGDFALWRAAHAAAVRRAPLLALEHYLRAIESYSDYFGSIFYRHARATKRLLEKESKASPFNCDDFPPNFCRSGQMAIKFHLFAG